MIVPPPDPQFYPEGCSFSEANTYNLGMTAGTLSHIFELELYKDGMFKSAVLQSFFFSRSTILDKLRLSAYAIKHDTIPILKQISWR